MVNIIYILSTKRDEFLLIIRRQFGAIRGIGIILLIHIHSAWEKNQSIIIISPW